MAAPIAEPVPDGLIFDTEEALSLGQLLALRAAGFLGGIRTVTFTDAPDPSDITAREVSDFMSAGLGLMIYQRVRSPGWLPSALLGSSDAAVALRKLAVANYLETCSLWDDLEGIGGSDASTVAYANAKTRALLAAKRFPGEYVGFDVPLTGAQLYHELAATCYWRSTSDVPDVDIRSYALRQVAVDVLVAGCKVDISVASADRMGGRARWMRAAA